ncbi:MAG: PAS domain-containing protein, partial [Planctomycetes bacterium]|nr:PAS domain-containing protein [Planctomycetota bacterium]
AAAQRPRVLYVHSYHLGRQWEDDMTAAVNVAMPDKDFCVFHEFLNANRASLTPAYLAERRRQFRQAYANEDIDLLLVSDDPALEFVMDDYDGFFAGLPVVFAGVNDYRDPKLARFPRFTGVAQTLSAAQTLRMILRLHPDTKRVVVVNDASISGKAWQKEIALQAQEVSEVADGRLRLDFCSGRSLAEVRAVAKAQAPGAVVLLGMFLTDSRGIYCPTGQGVALIGRNCQVPVYSLMPMQGERGIIGGKVATAAEQGRAMAEIAMAVLGGRCRLEEIPVRKDDSRNVWEFDCPSLLAHGIDEARARAAVRAVDGPEAAARAVFYHRREPFTVRYPTLFWGLVGGGAAAIVVIALLLFHDRRQRTLNDLLARQGEELRAQSASLAAQTALQKQQAGILEKQVAERNRILANLSERMRDAMRLPFLQGEAVPEGLALGGAAPGEAPPSANPERAFSEFAAGIYAMFDALAASVHQLALLFDTMSSGFVLNAAVDGPGGATVDYRILKVNPAAEKLLGRPPRRWWGGLTASYSQSCATNGWRCSPTSPCSTKSAVWRITSLLLGITWKSPFIRRGRRNACACSTTQATATKRCRPWSRPATPPPRRTWRKVISWRG